MIHIRDNLQRSAESKTVIGQTTFAILSLLFQIPLLVFFLNQYWFTTWEIQFGARVAIFVSAILYINVTYLYRERYWSVPSLTFLILCLFHIGLFSGVAWSGEIPQLVLDAGTRGAWFRTSEINLALNYALLGLIAYSIGLTLSVIFWQRMTRYSAGIGKNLEDDRLRESFALLGIYLLTVSVLAWFLLSIRFAGITFFLMDYGEYLAVSGRIPGMNYTYIGISYGVMFAFFSSNKKKLIIAIAVFSSFTIASLLIGMRDNALIPVVCAAAVWAKFNNKRRGIPLLLGVIIVLSVMNVVREVRYGFNNSTNGSSLFSPISAIEEMGASLRVLHTTVTWHVANGEPLKLGATYLGPFSRFLDKFLGPPDLSMGYDPRIMGQEVGHRAGSIGGSMIAEAHHNFGLLGIILVLLVFGLIVGYFTLSAVHPVGIAMLGVLTALFLMHVRNSFTPIPFWLIVGLLFIWVIARPIPGRRREFSDH